MNIITPQLLLSIISFLIAGLIALAIYFIIYYHKSEEAKHIRKDIEIKEEREGRKELANKIFNEIVEFKQTITKCQTHIENLYREIIEIKIDIKELEKAMNFRFPK